MRSAAQAGAAYFLVVFAAGFVLGTFRVLWLEPRVGELAAVSLELPWMLGVCWMSCGWLVRRFEVPATRPRRLVMGGLAFLLLMVAELGLGLGLFARSMRDVVDSWTRLPGALGLLGQILFASFPLMRP